MCAEKVLESCKATSIPELVEREDFSWEIDNAVDPSKPMGVLSLLPDTQNRLRQLPIVCSPRVGLTLKRFNKSQEKYIMRPYRFLIIPSSITKGSPTLALAIWANKAKINPNLILDGEKEEKSSVEIKEFQQGGKIDAFARMRAASHSAGSGDSCAEVVRATRVTTQGLKKYIADFESGKKMRNVAKFHSLNLKVGDLCQLYGACWANGWCGPVAGYVSPQSSVASSAEGMIEQEENKGVE